METVAYSNSDLIISLSLRPLSARCASAVDLPLKKFNAETQRNAEDAQRLNPATMHITTCSVMKSEPSRGSVGSYRCQSNAA